jgi:hypothetical protein
MRYEFISTRVHGILDYLVGAFLMATPWVFGFWRNGAESWVPIWLGAAAVVYSLLTNYELGAAKLLTMRAHLWLDLVSGVFLAASPWIFRFDNYVYVPHVVLGFLEIGVSLMTDRQPYEKYDPT